MAIHPTRKDGARFRRVSSEMYADAKFVALSPQRPSAQSLWIYLLTGPFSCLIPGIVIGGEAGIAERLRWPLPHLRRCFQEIASQGMARADWTAPLVFLPNGLRHNLPQSPSVVAGWRQAWLEIPACRLKLEAAAHMRRVLAERGDAFVRAFDALSLPSRSGESQSAPQPAPQSVTQPLTQPAPQPASVQEQEQDQDPPPTPSRREGGHARRPHPLDEGAVLESWSVEACDAYLSAYPQKQGRMDAYRAWHELNPDRETAAAIMRALAERNAAGWHSDLQFVPFPGKFIRERRWEEPFVRRLRAAETPAMRLVPSADETAAYLKELGAVRG